MDDDYDGGWGGESFERYYLLEMLRECLEIIEMSRDEMAVPEDFDDYVDDFMDRVRKRLDADRT